MTLDKGPKVAVMEYIVQYTVEWINFGNGYFFYCTANYIVPKSQNYAIIILNNKDYK